MTTLATYMLTKSGFDVELSWSIEGGRSGNPALMDYINHKMIQTRPVPLWLTTNSQDGFPRTPKSVEAGGATGRLAFQVYISSNEPANVILCIEEDMLRPIAVTCSSNAAIS